MGPTTKPSRKRQAPAQDGPRTKRAHVEKSAKLNADATASQKGKKRSQPVTRPIQESDGSELEVTDEEELEGGQLVEDDDLGADELLELGEAPAKDPNGAHTFTRHRRINC